MARKPAPPREIADKEALLARINAVGVANIYWDSFGDPDLSLFVLAVVLRDGSELLFEQEIRVVPEFLAPEIYLKPSPADDPELLPVELGPPPKAS